MAFVFFPFFVSLQPEGRSEFCEYPSRHQPTIPIKHRPTTFMAKAVFELRRFNSDTPTLLPYHLAA